MIQMQLGGLGFDPKNMSPIILLKDTEERNFYPFGLECLKPQQLQWNYKISNLLDQ